MSEYAQLSLFNKYAKALKINHQDIDKIFSNALEGIVIIQGEKIVFLNERVLNITGYSLSEVLNSPLSDFIYPEDKGRVLYNLKARQLGKEVENEYNFRVIGKDKNIIWFHSKAFIINWLGKRAVFAFLYNITEYKEAQRKLQETVSILENVLNTTSDSYIVIGKNKKVLFFNKNFAKLIGVSEEKLKSFNIFKILKIVEKSVSDKKVLHKLKANYLQNQIDIFKDYLCIKNGNEKIIYKESLPFYVDGVFKGRVCLIRDVSKEKKYERKLLKARKEYEELVENVNAIVLRWKPDGKVKFINKYGLEFFKFKEDEIVGKSVLDTIVPHYDDSGNDLYKMIKKISENPEEFIYNENENVDKYGNRYWIVWRNKPVYDENGNFVEILSIGSDYTEQKKLKDKLKELAEKDSLTGIYNRRKFLDILEKEIEKSKRYDNKLSILLMDIDDFKKINDTYGHEVGDFVLKLFSTLVIKNIRKSDIFARWGGEEFVILTFTDLNEAKILGEKICHVVSSFKFDDLDKVTVSIGITDYKDSENINSFINRADSLMYKAKKSGKNKVAVV